MKSHDRTRVALVDVILVQAGFGTSAVVSVSLIDVAFFCPNPECGGFVVGKVKRGDCYFTRFIVTSMYQLECFLEQEPLISVNYGYYATNLRLREHVYQPTADCPICTACDQIMSVLRSYHLHRINGMCMSRSRQRRFQHR